VKGTGIIKDFPKFASTAFLSTENPLLYQREQESTKASDIAYTGRIYLV
jgi:hypothetical protein